MRHLLLSFLYLAFSIATADAEVFKSWETICEPKCRSFTTKEVTIFPGEPPYLVLLEVDENNQLVVSALVTEEQHYAVFANKAPVELRRVGKKYVPARTFFNERFSAMLLVDGAEISTLSAYDESHIGAEVSSDLLESFRRGSTAELVYASGYRGKGQRISFSLIGFSAAFAAIS